MAFASAAMTASREWARTFRRKALIWPCANSSTLRDKKMTYRISRTTIVFIGALIGLSMMSAATSVNGITRWATEGNAQGYFIESTSGTNRTGPITPTVAPLPSTAVLNVRSNLVVELGRFSMYNRRTLVANAPGNPQPALINGRVSSIHSKIPLLIISTDGSLYTTRGSDGKSFIYGSPGVDAEYPIPIDAGYYVADAGFSSDGHYLIYVLSS
jgi:hypothetical protein